MRVIHQKSFNDCGFACLAMISRHHRRPVALEDLAAQLPVDEWLAGTSLKQIGELAEGLGLEARTVRCSRHALPGLPMPALAHCRTNHYVVVERVDAQRAVILDPQHGRSTVPLSVLDTETTGLVTLFRPSGQRRRSAAPGAAARRFRRSDPWVRGYRSAFLGAGLALAPVALFAAAFELAAGAGFLAALGGGVRAAAGPAVAVALVLLLGGPALERFLLGRYRRLTRRLGQLCLAERARFLEHDGGYRLLDRFRWLVEILFFQRQALFRCLFVAATLVLLATAGIAFRSGLLILAPAAMALAMLGDLAAWQRHEKQGIDRATQRREIQDVVAHAGTPSPGPGDAIRSRPFGLREEVVRRLVALARFLPEATGLLLLGLAPLRMGANQAADVLVAGVALALLGWGEVRGGLEGFDKIRICLDQLTFMSYLHHLRETAGRAPGDGLAKASGEG